MHVPMRSIDFQQDTYGEIGGTCGNRSPRYAAVMRQVKCPMPRRQMAPKYVASDNTALGTLEATFYRSMVGQMQFLAVSSGSGVT